MYEDELLEGGFESIEQRTQWEAELQAAEEKLQRLDADIAATEEEAKATAPTSTQQDPSTPPEQSTQQQPPLQAEPARAQAKGSLFAKEDGTIDYDKIAAYGREGDMDVLTGIGDFVKGTLSLIPGIEFKQTPKFENEVAQSVREISSVVLPTMVLGGAGSAGLSAQAAKVRNVKGLKVLSDPFVKWLGNTSFQAGAGAFVDYSLNMSKGRRQPNWLS